MKTNHIISISLLVVFLLCWDGAIAQKKTRTRLKAYYEQLSNKDLKISVILIQGTGKKMANVQNAEVLLSTFNQDDEIFLTNLITDDNGEAELIIEKGYKLPINEKGYAVIKASYAGNDSLKAAKKQIKFMDLNVEISFDIIDSIKQITVTAFEIDSIGNKIPIEGVNFNIGVERLYSILYLEKIKTDESGTRSMEFPNDIPGDSVGILNVVVKVIEDKKYGTITKAAQIDWGTIVDFSNAHADRSLFGDQAPLWMIIAVFVILAGAWYHFILAILKVNKIRTTDQDEAFL